MGGPKQKGIIQYSKYIGNHVLWKDVNDTNNFDPMTIAVSPFQQRAFKGVLSGYLFNGYTRLVAQAPYFLIPFAAGEFIHPPDIPTLHHHVSISFCL